MRNRLLGTSALFCAGALLVPVAPAVAAPAAGAVNSVEEVVVTGSRIKRNEFTSPDPIQVIDVAQAEAKGIADTPELIRSASSVAGSFQQTTGLTNFGLAANGQGSQTVSLRGLEAQRTLVILNGRRAGPAGVSGNVSAVDLNVLPTSIIERVEILKDGASSIYGSDAIAGVVNVLTKQKFEGGTLDLYGNQPSRKGGEQYRISGSYGWVFDKGYFNISGEHYEQKPLLTGQRDYLRCQRDVITNAATGASADIIDNVTGQAKCFDIGNTPGIWGGAFVSGVGVLQYDPTNSAGPYPAASNNKYFAQGWRLVNIAQNPASFAPSRTYATMQDNRTALLGLKVDTAFAQGAWDLTPNVQAYGEFLLNRRVSHLQFAVPLSFSITAAQPSNPFGATAIPGLLYPTGGDTTVDYTRFVGGLRGKFDLGALENWDYDLWFGHSQSRGTYTGTAFLQDSVNYNDGNPANGECGVAGVTQTPIGHRACVSVDWFSPAKLANPPTPLTAAEVAYLISNSAGHTTYDQDIVEGSVAGNLFQLPAGPLGAAIGFQVRRDKINDQPDAQAQAFNQTFLNALPTIGSDSVKEAFAELAIPIVKDLPLIKSLDVSLSGRYEDYRSYGTNSTYRVGLNWRVNDWARLHATKGTSFRAPALFEQFQGNANLIYNQVIGFDPCLNWQLNASATVQKNCIAAGVPSGLGPAGAPAAIETRGGAKGAKPETSDAWSAGVVFTPAFADLSIAVDYWEMKVSNELSFYNSNQVGLCYASTNFPNDPFCSLFHRNATTHYVDTIDDHYVNISEQNERGIDLTGRYRRDLGWFDFSSDAQLTWKLQDDRVLYSGAATTDRLNRVGYPAVVGNANFRATRGPWAVNWGMDFYGHASDQKFIATTSTTNAHAAAGTTVAFKDFTEATWYHSLSVRYRMPNGYSVTAGVQNLFDQEPPVVSSNEGTRRGVSALPNYDLLGRRFFLQLHATF